MNAFHISESELLSRTGKIEYLKNGRLTPSATFIQDDKVRIRAWLPRALGAVGASLNFYSGYTDEPLGALILNWEDSESAYDIYSVRFDPQKFGPGLIFAALKVDSLLGELGAELCGTELIFKSSGSDIKSIQITVSDFEHKAPEKFEGGIIYHIFVDRFAKSDKIPRNSEADYVDAWDAEIPEYPAYPGAPLKNTYLYGGDLYGIKEKLPYLKSLGVTLIYLSPIFESPSNHKYDTADYMTVDPAFGGEEALRELITAAKRRGIGIILDGVFNHTGADSIYFNKYSNYPSIGAYQSKSSPYYGWYDFRSYPDEYTSWWGIEILPRINPDKPELSAFLSGEGGVVDKYARMGISGFRLDVADELSDEFISSIKTRLSASSSDNILYGEVWEDASNKIAYDKRKKYFIGSELDGVMNYTVRKGLISYIRKKETDALRYALTDVIFNAPERIRNIQMNLLGSHDTERILTALAGEAPNGKSNDQLAKKRMTDRERALGRARYICAYTVAATLPGIPSVFYGDEAGMEGYSDPFNRLTYPWGKQDKAVLSEIKRINKIRRENDVYKHGEYALLHLDRDILIFSRHDAKDSFVTAVNNKGAPAKITASKPIYDLISGRSASEHTIPPESAMIFKIKKGTSIEF